MADAPNGPLHDFAPPDDVQGNAHPYGGELHHGPAAALNDLEWLGYFRPAPARIVREKDGRGEMRRAHRWRCEFRRLCIARPERRGKEDGGQQEADTDPTGR